MSGAEALGNGGRIFYDQEEPEGERSEWGDYESNTFKRGEASEEEHTTARETEMKAHSPARRSRSPRSPDRKGDRGRESRRYTPYSRDSGRDRRSDRGSGPRKVASRDCRVYVTNIAYELKWQELKDVMRKAGDVMYVEMIMNNDGRPRGSAVVEFSQPEDAARAIKEFDNYELMGRKLQLREDKVDDDHYQRQVRQHKDSEHSRRSQSSQMSSLGGLGLLGGVGNNPNMGFLNSKSSDSINSTVFVSNLDYNISWQKVKDTFRKAGNVTRVDLAEDSNKRSKGYGTVVFSTPMEALQAVSMFNGYVFGDRAIVARLDRESNLAKLTGGQSSSSGHSMGNQQSAAAVNPMLQLQLQSLVALSALTGGGLGALGGAGDGGRFVASTGLSGSSSSSIGLGNQGIGALGNSGLGALTGLGGLGNLLSGLGGGSSLGALGQGAGYSDSAGYGGSSSSVSKYGGGGGSSSRDDSSRQIFVRNLPWKTTWQELKDRFRHCGHVVRADVLTDDRGRSKGCGTVVFEHVSEAQNAAAEMNGFSLDGRNIEVRMDRNA